MDKEILTNKSPQAIRSRPADNAFIKIFMVALYNI